MSVRRFLFACAGLFRGGRGRRYFALVLFAGLGVFFLFVIGVRRSRCGFCLVVRGGVFVFIFLSRFLVAVFLFRAYYFLVVVGVFAGCG